MKPRIHQVAATTTFVLLTFALTTAIAGEPTYYGATAEARQTSDDEMRAKRFDDQLVTVTANFGEILERTIVQCDLHAVNRGEPVKGVRGSLNGLLAEVGPVGNIIRQIPLPQERLKTGRDGYDSAYWDPSTLGLPLAPDTNYAIQMINNLASGKPVTEAETTCRLLTYDPCLPGPSTLCLSDNRFRVEAMFGNQPAQVFRQQGNEGILFFNNTDLLIQILDGCGAIGPGFDHFWVFYGATTNVEFEITVTDTQAGESRVYDNPLGTAAPAITDTSAFATCP